MAASSTLPVVGGHNLSNLKAYQIPLQTVNHFWTTQEHKKICQNLFFVLCRIDMMLIRSLPHRHDAYAYSVKLRPFRFAVCGAFSMPKDEQHEQRLQHQHQQRFQYAQG